MSDKLSFSLWRKLFNYVIEFKGSLIKLSLVMSAVAGIDVLVPYLNKYAIDTFVENNNMLGLKKFAVVYLVIIIIQAINIKIFINVAGKVETGLAYHIRRISFEKLQKLSLSYYDKTSVGWIISRVTSDVMRLSEIVSWGLIDMVWALVMMFGFVIIMMIHNVKLTLITLSVVPPLIIIGIYFQRKILDSYRDVRKINSKITAGFNECITGAKTTKTLVTELDNLEEFKVTTGDMRSSSLRAAIFSSLFLPIVLTLGSIGTGLALWYGGKGVLLETLSYGTLVMFLAYSIQFFEPITQLATTLAELQHAQASAERVISLIEEKIEIQDSEEIINKYGDIFNPKNENWEPIHGDITFKDISFAYKDGEKVLDNFNLQVKKGEKIALVGETGSGKSTIVNLLCRFYEPTDGEVLIDGVDYRERSILWLQSNLGYVLQSPHLFSGTIKDNIKYGKLNATDEEVMKAAQLVNAHDFIIRMENGYNTEVGEGGNKLSTGEKQLISFARAIISNPSLFVLDEATSSIDTESEKIIQDAIDKVLKGRTSFIIAHRLSTIVSADKILVIQKGEIVEMGNHEELMKNKGYYYNLYTNQFIEEKEKEILNS
ncbi:ABC transporter ATP-binding protein/permease [Clostridium sp. MSJ-11]|uniref:ABC transporter ATP-binding protein/permease n=1 Tax=Clostridium mobile TaxID=2841512 RepID=A0ABS6EEP1_9CLOT|nr:ABC transporter ATP-binding protein [Clostridium mobile]MBU5482859.1 ABC transporter ATP-binding protein/permease [Clostridium mobile]